MVKHAPNTLQGMRTGGAGDVYAFGASQIHQVELAHAHAAPHVLAHACRYPDFKGLNALSWFVTTCPLGASVRSCAAASSPRACRHRHRLWASSTWGYGLWCRVVGLAPLVQRPSPAAGRMQRLPVDSSPLFRQARPGFFVGPRKTPLNV